ncbi:MAG: ABC transporter substrate-binding protein [Pseudohongiella sp.]|nr:MAG: ABC transporter substrate-binding protein [Pseudohongiella sp.]
MKARLLAVSLLLTLFSTLASPAVSAQNEPLRIGITLHPYYSFVSNIVGDRAEIIPLIDAGSNPHNYTPQGGDMQRALSLDTLVVNGIGHDEWAFEIIRAAGREDELPLIYANDGVPLIPIAGDTGDAKIVNPHTFVSITVAVQQIYTIARRLGELDPDNADFYRNNARAYALGIRRLKADYMEQLAQLDASDFRSATMHGAYGYLMQEFGLRVVAVIEPRHGVQPTARQLANTLDKIKEADVNVLFAEKYFASNLSDAIQDATGVSMFSFSHMSDGSFTADLFENETRANLETLLAAVRSVSTGN